MSKLELQRIVEAGAVTDKARLADALGALYLSGDKVHAAGELSLFYDIVRHIIHDVEMQVRRKLSTQMAERIDAPHDLIVMLADDEIEVAYPVLSRSLILKDTDLIRLIGERTTEYRVAIAGRQTVSAVVSKSLVATEDDAAISALLDNNGASFDTGTMTRLVEESMVKTEYQELLISRRDLPETLANRMYDGVSEALRGYIAEAFPAVGIGLDDAVSNAVDLAMEENLLGAGEPGWEEPPSEEALLRALEKDDIAGFEDSFRKLTGLSPAATARAIYDMGIEGLAIACRAAGLERDAFGEIFCHLRGRRPFGVFRNSAPYLEGMAVFDETDTEEVAKILESWRR